MSNYNIILTECQNFHCILTFYLKIIQKSILLCHKNKKGLNMSLIKNAEILFVKFESKMER